MDRGAWGLKKLDTIEATWQTYTQLSSISFFFSQKRNIPVQETPVAQMASCHPSSTSLCKVTFLSIKLWSPCNICRQSVKHL